MNNQGDAGSVALHQRAAITAATKWKMGLLSADLTNLMYNKFNKK